MNKVIVLAVLGSQSTNKKHEKQEVVAVNGVSCCVCATYYKDQEKVIMRRKHERAN